MKVGVRESVGVDRQSFQTYKAKGEDYECADAVGKHAVAKEVDIANGNGQVPEEVARRQALDHAAAARVAPDALLPVHVLALLVDEHDPEGEDVDDAALEQRDHVDVPAEAPLTGELGIADGENGAREDRAEVEVDEGVEGEGEQHFVDVQRQGGEVVAVGEGLDGAGEPRDGRDGEGIEHGCGCVRCAALLLKLLLHVLYCNVLW